MIYGRVADQHSASRDFPVQLNHLCGNYREVTIKITGQKSPRSLGISLVLVSVSFGREKAEACRR
jgi:hypothetical protein